MKKYKVKLEFELDAPQMEAFHNYCETTATDVRNLPRTLFGHGGVGEILYQAFQPTWVGYISNTTKLESLMNVLDPEDFPDFPKVQEAIRVLRVLWEDRTKSDGLQHK